MQTSAFKAKVKKLLDMMGDPESPDTLEGMLYKESLEVRQANDNFDTAAAELYNKNFQDALAKINSIKD